MWGICVKECYFSSHDLHIRYVLCTFVVQKLRTDFSLNLLDNKIITSVIKAKV